MTDILPIRICHIDSDSKALEILKEQLHEIPGIHLSGSFNNSLIAYHWLTRNAVDILFADVKMPGIDGVTLAQQFQEKYKYLVFTAPEGEYSNGVSKTYPSAYLYKPLKKAELERIIVNYRQMQRKFGTLSNSYEEPAELPTMEKQVRIVVNSANSLYVIQLADIVYIKSNGNYSHFHLLNGEIKISSRNLKSYTYLTDMYTNFVRIHRSSIINKNYVKAIETEGTRRLVRMYNNDLVEVNINSKGGLIDILLT